MTKTFSVVTINYNNLNGLKRTVDSVCSQTGFESIEFVVVDGGSTDGSLQYLQTISDKIDILISEKDNGIYDAMNKGLHAATSEYVWFVNSGDAIYGNSVVTNLLKYAKSGFDVIFGDTMFIDSKGIELGLISKLKPQKLSQKLNPNSFCFGMSICHQSFITKKAIAPEYNTTFRQASDIDWILNILESNPTNVNSGLIISAFETGGSSSQNEKKAWKERYQVLSNHYGVLTNLLNHVFIVFRRVLFNMGIWRNVH